MSAGWSLGGYDQSEQEEAHESPQPSEDATEIVADGIENDVGDVDEALGLCAKSCCAGCPHAHVAAEEPVHTEFALAAC